MAVLTDADRARVVGQWMRDNAAPNITFTKADLRLAVNACDDYLDNMTAARPATSLAAAVSAAASNFWTQASTPVKFDVLGYVMFRRAGRLVTGVDL